MPEKNYLRGSLRVDQVLFSILVVVFLLLAGWLLGQAVGLVGTAVSAITDVSVAIIGAATAILSAVVKHSLDLDRDRIQKQTEAENERKHQIFLAKQENYKDLLKKLGEFVRKGDQNPGVIDSFTAAHLGSFAFGDLNVVLSTNRFMEDPSRANLMEILYAMRKGLQHTELELWFKEKYNYEILYEPVVTTHDTILNKKRKEERSDNES